MLTHFLVVNTEREDFEPTLTLIIKFGGHDSVAWVWNSTECNTGGDRLMASNKQSVKGRAYMLMQKKKF